MKYLKELCQICAPSGEEKSVRDFIISKLGECDYYVDNAGNLIVEKKGKKTPDNKLMLAAHMDEVGFIITFIEDGGMLKFDTVGGIDAKSLLGKRVKIGDNIGVIGTAPIHLTDKESENKMPKVSEMFIDIGVSGKEAAEKLVSLGDTGTFLSDYTEYGDGFVKSKAIDDRFGCAVLLDIARSECEFDVTLCFTVREEIGLFGAGVAANRVKPDIALVIESTTANDICSVSGSDKVCSLGAGAVVSFMDGRTLYDKSLYRSAMNLAEEKGIKAQTKTKIAGGNDAGVLQSAGIGSRVLAVSLPTRYIHSSSCVAKKDDMKSVLDLTKELIKKFGNI